MDREAASRARTALLSATDASATLLGSLSGGVLEAFIYTSHGHRKEASESSRTPGFNGELPAAVTGHYLLGNGYRAYNPVLMRFNSPDNLSPFERGGLNAYGYCEGDPVNNRDPSGHISGPRFWAARMAKAVAPRAPKLTFQPRALWQQTADKFDANKWKTLAGAAGDGVPELLADIQRNRLDIDLLLPIMAKTGVGLKSATFSLVYGDSPGMLARVKSTNNYFFKHAARQNDMNHELRRVFSSSDRTSSESIQRWRNGRVLDRWLADHAQVGGRHRAPIRSRLPAGVEPMYIRDPAGATVRNMRVRAFT